MKIYLLIIFLFLKIKNHSNTIKSSKKRFYYKVKNNCLPQNIQITLGDYFQNEKSEIIYRVSFMQKKKNCINKIKLLLIFENEIEQIFQITKKRDYKLKGVFFRSEMNYKRKFFFIDLKNLKNPLKFTYYFLSDEKKVKGPYFFESNILNKKKTLKINSFGDHDLKKGKEIIKRLKKENYDLLILLGDYSYNMNDDNGKNGDEYFQGIEKILTKSPCIIIPGNHETIDNTLILNSRIYFPNTENPLDNNINFFYVHNLFFFVFNADYYYLNYEKKNEMEKKIENIFLENKKKNKNYFKIVLTHRPFYCQEQFNKPCILNSLFLKDVEEILIKNKIDLVLSGHLHFYERMKPQKNYSLKNNNYTQLIIGTGGNNHFFGKSNFKNSPFIEKTIFITEGFLQIQNFKKLIELSFIEAFNGAVLDNFIITKKNFHFIHDFILFGIFIFFLVIFLIFFKNKKKLKRTIEFEVVMKKKLDENKIRIN